MTHVKTHDFFNRKRETYYCREGSMISFFKNPSNKCAWFEKTQSNRKLREKKNTKNTAGFCHSSLRSQRQLIQTLVAIWYKTSDF